MDAYEATRTVMSRIQSLDPENASRIIGYILIHEQGEKEMIRLAYGPEALLLSYINQAKACLGLYPKPSTPFTNPNTPNYCFPQTSPRILVPNNGFHLSNPSPPPSPVSYAAVLNGTETSNGGNNGSGPSRLHFHGENNFGDRFLTGAGGPLQNHVQDQDQLSFADDSMADPIMSPSGRSDSMIVPYVGDVNSITFPRPHPFHKRNYSVDDAAFLSNVEEGNGYGWRPCMFFARGFCKNGSTCKFLHSDFNGGDAIEVGSPSSSASGFDEFWRMKAIQQPRYALMPSGGHHSYPYNKCMNLLTENHRNEFSPTNSSARQIYLTFPADSTFREEDVSSYFSLFGPVQDVRIPYQQKRMFGFVTFLYPETVKRIFAKGNPHFVCDSRVLVKPYKEKGKSPDKKQLQQQQLVEYPACLSPAGIDTREPIDLPIGSRMPFNTQEMMLRRKLEQEAELQHAIELQSQRMMNLQLMALKKRHVDHHFLPALPAGSPISSPRQLSHNVLASSDATNQDVFQDGQEASKFPAVAANDEKLVFEGTGSSTNNNVIRHNNDPHVNDNDNSYLPESLEHILPDNLFGSPRKPVVEKQIFFSQSSAEADKSTAITNTSSSNNARVLSSSSPFSMPPQMTRLEAIDM